MCSNEGYLDLLREFDDISDLENQCNTEEPEDNISQIDTEDDLSDSQELDDDYMSSWYEISSNQKILKIHVAWACSFQAPQISFLFSCLIVFIKSR